MSDMGIYKITNTANGKVYIGQSTRLSRRLAEHQADLKNNSHHNRHLQNSYNKYGDVFEVEIIEYCDDEPELDDLERYYIAYYDSMNPKKGYNKEDGGSLQKSLSEETKKKMSENSARYWQGKHFSDEHKRKLSKNHPDVSGENHPNWGKHRSEETRKRISEARNTTGFYRVYQQKDICCKQGFRWCYKYYENKKRKLISSTNLLKLKEKIENQNLPWVIIDEEKAKQSLELNKKTRI